MSLPLLASFLRLRAPVNSGPIIPPEARDTYGELAPDLDVVDRELAPVFAEYDRLALRDQNRYRRQQVLILLGSALLTGLGGLQAVFPEQRWPTLLLTVVGILLAASTRLVKEGEVFQSYMNARMKAERLRALHFHYLSRIDPYAGDDREIVLRRAVLAIRADREPE
ncbi:MAG: DUF4231 domain-containing protein [Nonomuraea sp.]|nr:DUF4231 domain-containing protein [Nonomuraea sp.]